MKTVVQQLGTYHRYHTHPTNRLTHFVGIPLIMLGLFIALYQVPLGAGDLRLVPLFFIAVLAYYFVLDWGLALGMLFIGGALLAVAAWISRMGLAVVWGLFAVSFVGGWVLQAIGHRIEGKKPAFFDNAFQLLIGPIYMLAEALFACGYRRPLQQQIEAYAAGPD